MSDAVESTRTLERPSQDGQVEQASDERLQGGTDGQTSKDNGKSAQEQDNIRKLQSTYDKKLADERKAFQAQQQHMQQTIQQLQRDMREAKKNSATDDFSKLELELQWAQQERDQYAQAYTQTLQQQQAEQERQGALREIADEFDVDVSDLADATDYKSAVKLAIKVQKDKEKAKQAQDDDRRERNSPDLGSGAPRTAMSDWDREYKAAMESNNTPLVMRLLRTRPK